MTAIEFRLRFSKNLGALLDRIGAPSPGFGRIKFLAGMFSISTSGANKWLSGHSSPEPHRYTEVCRNLKCTLDELLGDVLDDARTLPLPATPTLVTSFRLYALMGWAGKPTLVMSVQDDTMEPYVTTGDAVFVHEVTQFEGPGVYLLQSRFGWIIRRVIYSTTKSAFVLTPSNKRYDAEIVPELELMFGDCPSCDKLRVVGRIAGRLLNGR